MIDFRKRLKASREHIVDQDCRAGCVDGYVMLVEYDEDDNEVRKQGACPYCYPSLYPEKWTIN